MLIAYHVELFTLTNDIEFFASTNHVLLLFLLASNVILFSFIILLCCSSESFSRTHAFDTRTALLDGLSKHYSEVRLVPLQQIIVLIKLVDRLGKSISFLAAKSKKRFHVTFLGIKRPSSFHPRLR
jgi:hypothetical protein